MRQNAIKAGRAAALVACVGLAACSGTSGGGSSGSSIGSMLIAGTTAPAPVRHTEVEAGVPARPLAGDPWCPRVLVLDGGSTVQQRGGVITLGQLARECVDGPNGSVIVKIGAEGRVVLASAGQGRFDIPVRFVVSNYGSTIATRTQRASVTIPAGQTSGFFALVEEGIVVPANASETFDIEVGLGAAPAEPARRRRG